MKKSRLYYFFFSLIWLSITGLSPATFSVFAQNPQPYFRNYTTDHGLPSPEVHDIIQDDEGYMWFATDNGVSRFDGYTFRNFSAADGLNNNVVFHLEKGQQGRIWMATMSGKVYYHERDSIYAFAYNDSIVQYQSKYKHPIDFYLDSLDNVWLTLLDWAILKITSDGKCEYFQNQDVARWLIKIVEGYPLNIRQKAKNPEEQRLINSQTALTQKILFEIDDGNNLFNIEGNNSHRATGLYRSFSLKDGTLLLSFAQWLYFYKNGQKVREWADYGAVQDVKILDNGNFLMGLLGTKGLYYFKDKPAFLADEYQQFLPGISVSHVYQDIQGGIWASSLENGVFYCPDLNFKIYDENIGFSESITTCMAWKDDTTLFVGLRHGNTYELSINTGKIRPLPPHFAIRPINYDLHFNKTAQRLWIGNYGIGFLDVNSSKWQQFQFKNQIGRDRVLPAGKAFISKNQRLWGSGSHGFISINLKNPNEYWQAIDVGYRLRTFVTFPDSQNRLWIGNTNGLFEFKNNQPLAPEIEHPAFQVRTEDMGELPDSTLVIGTKGQGVIFWKDERIVQFTEKEGLTSNMVENIHIDEKQRVWVGTMIGLNKITQQADGQWQIEQLTTAHGLPSNEINQVKSNKGEVWVATSKGLVHLPERQINTFVNPPTFPQIQVNNEVVDAEKLAQLNYQENNLSFQVLSINYRLSGKIPYRHRLNETADWNYTASPNINFADLPPAAYTFYVQAQNEDGFWSESATLDFTIRPPFWQQWWFGALCTAYVGLMAYVFYRYRTNQIKREAHLQRQSIELEQAALRAQMNPHFIFNCLNSIQNFIIQNDQKNAISYLSRFARLVRSVLRFSMAGKISLEEEVQAIENYLALEKLRFKERFDYSIQVDKDLDMERIQLPPLLVQPFVENAIIHGMSNKEKAGIIQVYYGLEDQYLVIKVEDNGPGFESHQQQSSKKKKHKSVGMTLTKQRLKLLEESRRSDVVMVEEVKGKTGIVLGTRVTLKVGR